MTAVRHLMVSTEGNGRESLFECADPDCGRRLVFDHVGGRLVVIDRGDTTALHSGSTGLVGLSATPHAGHPDADAA